MLYGSKALKEARKHNESKFPGAMELVHLKSVLRTALTIIALTVLIINSENKFLLILF